MPDAQLVRDEPRWHYPTFNRTNGQCRLRVWHTETDDIIAMVTELHDNPSASITNSIERIRKQLVREYGEPLYLFEHYPDDEHRRAPATCDFIVVGDDGYPGWTPVQLVLRHQEFIRNVGSNQTLPVEILPTEIREAVA